MKNITMIAAIGKNNELGKDNSLIWHLKKDLLFFKEQTSNKPIVMGYKTLLSLPKLLPNRKHIVLTRHERSLAPSILVFHSKEEVLDYISNHIEEFMIIGGESIYKEFLEDADKMILTEIDDTCLDADSYFPYFDKNEWNSKIIKEEEENGISYKHLVYTRK